MITLPRSPIIKLLIAALAVATVAILRLQLQQPTTSFENKVDEWGELKKSFSSVHRKLQGHYQQPSQQQEGKKVGSAMSNTKTTAGNNKTRLPAMILQVPESLLLTHDIAIPHDIPPWTDEDTELLGTTIGASLQFEMLKLDYHKHEDLSQEPPKRLDFAELARAERLYKSLWNHVYPIYNSLKTPKSGKGYRNDRDRELALYKLATSTTTRTTTARPEIDFFLRLEKRLFPWIQYTRTTSFSLFQSYHGKGIVFCAGNPQFEFVVTAIQAIRSRLKSTLPIQVFYMGDDDLSQERQQYLREMTDDIELLDVTRILNNEYMMLGGWAIKPFAMLASSFEEVMFVDADAYFLQDPAILFQDPGYLATGALFFYDRTLFPFWTQGADFLKSILPIMSSFPKTSRWFRMVSAHEQESGVVLINKRKRFLGLLATCKMNGKWERDLVSYKIFHGDKETFWTGFEMVQEPYAFIKSYGGVIGELKTDPAAATAAMNQNSNKEKKSVCGAQLHEDHLGQPLWWNGGLYRNKNSGVTRYLDFGYWMTGGGRQKNRERFTNDPEQILDIMGDLELSSQADLKLDTPDAEWDFMESCLSGADVQALSQKQKDLANGYVSIDRVAREDGRKMLEGKPLDSKEHDWDSLQ
ncbi:hypothetical protein BG004_006618 [Podila humilis]|nr:hypothetical protein BG004_006618 [Podila humilis]